MDDDVNRSSDSLPTSEEFELVSGNGEPKFHTEGDEYQLQETMKEALQDIDVPKVGGDGMCHTVQGDTKVKEETSNTQMDLDTKKINENHFGAVQSKCNRISSFEQSMLMYTTSPSPMDEDLMSISISLADGDYTVFDRITYLGSAVVSDPTNDADVRKNMAVMNGQPSAKALNVSLSLPFHLEGNIILYEPSSSNEISSFPIRQIVAYVIGSSQSNDANCLSLVLKCSQDGNEDASVFQCHIFRCEVPEAVSKIVQCFLCAKKKKVPRLLSAVSEKSERSSVESQLKNMVTYVFDGSLELKEDDSRGGYASCPKDKDYFKLRCKLEKSIVVTVQQVSDNRELAIERCFGLLVSPGRNVRNSDMQLIERFTFIKPPAGERSPYIVSGLWDPNEPAFEILNEETRKDTRVYMTVAVDLVITGIQDPVRFVIETKAKIFPSTERFWYFARRTLYEQFYLRVREICMDANGEYTMQVLGVTSANKLKNTKTSLSLNLSSVTSMYSTAPTPVSPDDPDSISDNDEPLLSGTGEVSKDCTETQLEGWSIVLLKWRQNLTVRPKQLKSLVRRGIPEALRGEVWQLLAGCDDQKLVLETYKSLLSKNSNCESIIQRDIYRTFPAHELFTERNGAGQEALFKICKAYSIYDPEIGYCQGLSFLVAALLLHMPEEQAFSVFMKIMFGYQVRNMFRNAFEELHLKFYQLKKLMEDYLPGLNSHFEDLGIEVHMFASQWFLTLFTAKFPLITVFFIIDLFLFDGMDVIFQVAIALLTLSQKELLALDFEGILKHFRVSLPKKYRTEESSKLLIQNAVKVKVKKLKRYEKDYAAFKEQEKLQGDPVKILQNENKRLLEANLSLDRENDDLTHDLLNIKLHLQDDLVKSEEKVECLTKELQSATSTISELDEEKKRLSLEVAQLKEMLRREMQRSEADNSRHFNIIKEYEQVCKQLNARLEKEQALSKHNLRLLKEKTEACEACSEYFSMIYPNMPSVNVTNESLLKKSSGKNAENEARELELELARTKLALVEAECKNQDLTHQLNAVINELQTSKNTWFQKTISTFRDVTKRESPMSPTAKDPSGPFM